MANLYISLNIANNPSNTEFAIQETGSTNYIQTNGTLGPTPIWHTNTIWGVPITLSGLNDSATYYLRVKARNGDNIETSFTASIAQTTLAPNYYVYMGVSVPTSTSSSDSCALKTVSRGYYTNPGGVSINNTIYTDVNLTVPLSGYANMYIALSLNGTGAWISTQIDGTGKIINTRLC